MQISLNKSDITLIIEEYLIKQGLKAVDVIIIESKKNKEFEAISVVDFPLTLKEKQNVNS